MFLQRRDIQNLVQQRDHDRQQMKKKHLGDFRGGFRQSLEFIKFEGQPLKEKIKILNTY